MEAPTVPRYSPLHRWSYTASPSFNNEEATAALQGKSRDQNVFQK